MGVAVGVLVFMETSSRMGIESMSGEEELGVLREFMKNCCGGLCMVREVRGR